MSISLSSHDVEQLAHAVELLVSPLDHCDSVGWRAAVNGHLKQLLRADSAGFLLPVPGGPLFFSAEHDPAELARYPQLPPPPLPDGTPCHARASQIGVSTLSRLYGDALPVYLRSEYYNEYAAPNRAHDTLGVMSGEPGAPVHEMVSLQFWHECPRGRRFGEREVSLLRVLLPALQAGVDTMRRFGHARGELMRSIDLLDEPVLVVDLGGRVLHQTPAFTTMLAADPERELLRHAALNAARCLTAPLRGAGDVGAADSVARDLRTGRGQYRLRASLHSCAAEGMVLVLVKRQDEPRQLTDVELGEHYGLTAAECRVARLLAEGRSNADIATTLCNSPHTVRHHTERVLLKLAVRSRAEVARRLAG